MSRGAAGNCSACGSALTGTNSSCAVEDGGGCWAYNHGARQQREQGNHKDEFLHVGGLTTRAGVYSSRAR